MSPKKAEYWNRRFEEAHTKGEKGPEEFMRVWLDFVKVSALQKARRSGDGRLFNTVSGELERIYRTHLV
ncbi:hypothetical protein OHA98_41085 [Streptomyces sp. NBC_00654]|uniref:hypothetical protein n=1 Tax=Streptomyces sp. NBC_00654 TaxID=2975799 RepID=UPI0022530820|nr:hypothetical protein [Streptomyces sp. NBC_00654]MCX4971011.1 hypothetical protein [Streptomyces sp. NBC_00654]